jgi:hypothetical protein
MVQSARTQRRRAIAASVSLCTSDATAGSVQMAKRSSKRFCPYENIFAFVSSSNKTVIPVRLDNSIFLPLGELRAFPPTITQVLQSTTNAHATVEMDLIKTIF